MKLRVTSALLFLLIVAVLLSACSASSSKVDKVAGAADTIKKDTLVLAIGGEPDDGFDPTTGWGQYGSPLFQSTLLTRDEDLNIKNDLAINYEVSEDGLSWTVEIRDDVKFSDGQPLTAEDVVFTFEKSKTSGSVLDLNNLSKVDEVDPHTIQFTLQQPEITFIYQLTSIGIVPKHHYSDMYQEDPIGSGPYKLVQWDKGQQLIVEENPHYYGKKPYFKQLTFLFLSEDAAFAAAKAGEVDVVSVPPTFAKEEMAGMKVINVESVDNRGIAFPYVKAGNETEDGVPIGNDVTADKAIRAAINIGIDREALVDGVLEGFGTPAYSVADKLPWWNPETKIEDGDMEQAKSILEEAGWKENSDGVREKEGLQASFTLLYPADDQNRQSLSMAFADMMKPLGIKVETAGKSWNELGDMMFSNPVMMGWGSHDPLEMYNIYSSETRGEDFYNTNFYSNPTVDTYMEKAMQASSQEEANKYWQKAQWDGKTGLSAMGDAPWAWLVNLEHVYFIRDNLVIGDQKVQPHGHGWPITDFISNWHWDDEKEG